MKKIDKYGALLCVLFFFFFEYALRVSDSVIIPELSKAFHIQAAGISLLSASYYISYVIMQIPAGIILDRTNLRHTIITAITLVAGGAIFIGFTHHLVYAVIARVAMGIGSAFAFIASVKIIKEIVHTQSLSFWIGIIMTVGTLGAVCGQEPWFLFVTFLHSWRAGYLLAGIIGICLIALSWKLVPSYANSTKRIKTKSNIGHMFKSGNFWLLAIYIGLLSAPITAFVALWGVPFLSQGLSLNRNLAATIMAFAWIGGLLGGPTLGFLADYFNIHKKLLIFIGCAVAAIMYFILFVHVYYSILFILFFFLGLLCNGNVIVFAIMAQIFGKQSSGTVIGVVNLFNMGGGPLLQLAIGSILATQKVTLVKGAFYYSRYEYQLAIIIMPILLLVSSCCLFMMRRGSKYNISSTK